MNLRVAAPGGRGRGGRGPGGPPAGAAALYGVQRVMRQRANQVHISAYDQFSDAAFDARPYVLTGPEPPKLPAWNERTGGNIGGPVRIPHIYDGSDKTFFFVNVQSAWSRNAVDQFSTVPTLFERENVGNFCDLPTAPSLYVPTNMSMPFGARTSVGCALPSGDVNSAAQGLFLNYYPAPNVPGGLFVDNYQLQELVPTQTTTFNTRVLQTISSKLNARVIYNLSEAANHAFQNFSSFQSKTSTRGQSVTLGLTYNINRTWLNDSQLIFTRNRSHEPQQLLGPAGCGRRAGHHRHFGRTARLGRAADRADQLFVCRAALRLH